MSAASNVVRMPEPVRKLDPVTLRIIRDRLLAARMELHQAYLFARVHPEAKALVSAAGAPLKGTLVIFEDAYKRGWL